jgi:hypothetical protein
MLWRYRFVTEQWRYQLLGGVVDEGEDAAGTAAGGGELVASCGAAGASGEL